MVCAQIGAMCMYRQMPCSLAVPSAGEAPQFGLKQFQSELQVSRSVNSQAVTLQTDGMFLDN